MARPAAEIIDRPKRRSVVVEPTKIAGRAGSWLIRYCQSILHLTRVIDSGARRPRNTMPRRRIPDESTRAKSLSNGRRPQEGQQHAAVQCVHGPAWHGTA